VRFAPACAGTAGRVTTSASAAATKIVRVIGMPLWVACALAPTAILAQGDRFVSRVVTQDGSLMGDAGPATTEKDHGF
jgi:hypothetical protein